METSLETVEGMHLTVAISPLIWLPDAEKMEAVLSNPYILITDRKITRSRTSCPCWEKVVQAGRELSIIAEDMEGEAWLTLAVNKLRGTLRP